MNNETEAINHFLAWLLQNPHPVNVQPSGTAFSLTAGQVNIDFSHRSDRFEPIDSTGISELQWLDPLGSEEVEALLPNLIESGIFPFEESLFRSGESPAVQDRFYDLMKHRLRAEIERNPPRFPWETEAVDYVEQTAAIAPTSVWATQLQVLSLPVPMPDAVLKQLFEHCQSVVQSSLKEGVKLVQIVTDLFPNRSNALNQLAGLVLTTPHRSGPSLLQSGLPQHYDQATEPQQMVLSLLAARTILEATTFRLSASQPNMERQWQTAIGPLKLEAQYVPQDNRVRIFGHLPGQGSLSLKGKAAEAIAQCAAVGEVGAELSQLEPNQTYLLTVDLQGGDCPPLVFAVCPTTVD